MDAMRCGFWPVDGQKWNGPNAEYRMRSFCYLFGQRLTMCCGMSFREWKKHRTAPHRIDISSNNMYKISHRFPHHSQGSNNLWTKYWLNRANERLAVYPFRMPFRINFVSFCCSYFFLCVAFGVCLGVFFSCKLMLFFNFSLNRKWETAEYSLVGVHSFVRSFLLSPFFFNNIENGQWIFYDVGMFVYYAWRRSKKEEENEKKSVIVNFKEIDCGVIYGPVGLPLYSQF